ncbi:O-acetyltransferase OatA [Pigmentiphaga humi]|uniref:O-acetyltransferase OatA n=1 Tax=Pigmentiphaga humi TaxID=2478468 RepID=A0A3P4B330_9BURK|nr:acyltransferase family protein [Pigmentiphaga humi]VCU70110.1 O-acetyltransferase OatA [Pigmentiphaga humi]
MRYRLEIDGLRAIAVLPVIFFHAGVTGFGGGFVGVDVFFVISGYLITGIIIEDLCKERFSLVHFYERRSRRILPALFVVLFVCLPFAWLWLPPDNLRNFARSVVAVAVFASNIFFWRSSGTYFSTSSELLPLLHTWSLAVEEQYYLFFPVFMFLLRKKEKKNLLLIIGLIAFASFCLALYAVRKDSSFAFYMLPSRSWELLLGALLAIALPVFKTARGGLGWRLKLEQFGSLLGLVLIFGSVAFLSGESPFPGVSALIPTIGAVLVIACAHQETMAGKFLSFKPIVGIGLISYSAYLWHQPILVFSRFRFGVERTAELAFFLVSLSLVLAYVSWRFVEQPFRKKERIGRRAVFTVGAVGLVAAFGVGMAGYVLKGFPERLPAWAVDERLDMPTKDNGWCFNDAFSSHFSVDAAGVECWLGMAGSEKKALLFGDSYAAQYDPLWDEVGQTLRFQVHSVTTNWCYPSLQDGYTASKMQRSYQQCMYDRTFFSQNVQNYDFVVLGGDWQAVSREGHMEEVRNAIAYAASKAKLVVIMPSPKRFDENIMFLYKKSALQGVSFNIENISTNSDRLVEEANALVENEAKKYSNVIFLKRDTLFSAGATSNLTRAGVPYSYDGRHINVFGAKQAAREFMSTGEGSTFQAALDASK